MTGSFTIGQQVLTWYLLFVNIVAFAAYGIDKRKAIKQKWRISEATLLILAAIGGSIGALTGMHVFHHKTRKLKFKAGVPAILLLQAGLLIWLAAGGGV